jgi:hypothetical protein
MRDLQDTDPHSHLVQTGRIQVRSSRFVLESNLNVSSEGDNLVVLHLAGEVINIYAYNTSHGLRSDRKSILASFLPAIGRLSD